MNPRRFATKRWLAIGVAVLAVAVGASAAIAETSGVFDPKAEHQAFESAVAKHLGVTTQQLEDAYKAAALERLDAAVAAGRITKAQADAIRSRIESDGFLGPFGMLGGPGMHAPGGGHLSAAAAYLGIDEATLADKLEAGESLADVARALNKSVEGLKQALVADEKKELDQAVEDGRLTSSQRDELLARIEAHVDDMVNGTGFPAGPPPFGAPFGLRFQGPQV